MKDVIIKIVGYQGLEDDTETVELTTVGKCGERNGEILLSYIEGELVGKKGVKTYLRYKAPDTVILQRSGEVESRMVIEKDGRHTCLYNAGYGDLLLDIIGKEVEFTKKNNGFRITMCYRIDAAGRPLSENKVEITVREV